MDNIEIDDINIEFHIASKQEAEKSSAFLLDEKEMIEVKDEEKTYYINSSLIKKFLKKGTEIDYCAAKVYALYIAKTHKSLPTESMLKGLFFETGCIGATQNGEGVYDLPRNKKTGAKSIDQIRLEQQIQVFKSMYKEHDIRIEKDNIQLKLGKPFGYVNGVYQVEENYKYKSGPIDSEQDDDFMDYVTEIGIKHSTEFLQPYCDFKQFNKNDLICFNIEINKSCKISILYIDECTYCFDNNEHLKSFECYGENFLKWEKQ